MFTHYAVKSDVKQMHVFTLKWRSVGCSSGAMEQGAIQDGVKILRWNDFNIELITLS